MQLALTRQPAVQRMLQTQARQRRRESSTPSARNRHEVARSATTL